MSGIYKNGKWYGKNAIPQNISLSQAEFDALPQSEKDNGTTYFIEDGDYLVNKAIMGYTPVGTIISVMGNNAPRHYLACNGQTVNIADYPELANYFEQQFGSKNYFGGDGMTTFGIPDLRGEFLRGTGTNGHENNGNGANVGIHQDSTTIPSIVAWNTNDKIGVMVNTAINNDIRNVDKANISKNPSGSYHWSAVQGTSESTGATGECNAIRPTNTSVLWCIATKNIYLNPSLDYSTDEKVVGTWIDGKPLYQRVLQLNFGTISAPGTFETVEYPLESLGLINIDYIFIASAWAPSVGGGYSCYPIPYTTTEGYQIKCAVHPSGKIQLVSSATSFSGVTARLIVQYTKTTD